MWDLRLAGVSDRSTFEYEALLTYDPDLLSDDRSKPLDATPDLCFKVLASHYFGAGGFDSRPAVIPSAAIDAALARLANPTR
jgi:hypothetical protein